MPSKPIAWHELDLKSFKLKAPETWNIFKEQGVDAYIGGITNGTDSLWFYYGWYISGPKDNNQETHLYAQETINGHLAIIEIPKKDSIGGMQVFIPNVTANDQFALGGHNIKDQETVLKIFRSVRFEGSDTLSNSNVNVSKFREYPYGSGRTLYYGFCSPCHFPSNKEMTGPPLTTAMKNKTTGWIYKFLTDRTSVTTDSMHTAAQSTPGCFEFKELSKQDVAQIVEYIKTFKPD